MQNELTERRAEFNLGQSRSSNDLRPNMLDSSKRSFVRSKLPSSIHWICSQFPFYKRLQICSSFVLVIWHHLPHSIMMMMMTRNCNLKWDSLEKSWRMNSVNGKILHALSSSEVNNGRNFLLIEFEFFISPTLPRLPFNELQCVFRSCIFQPLETRQFRNLQSSLNFLHHNFDVNWMKTSWIDDSDSSGTFVQKYSSL